jgi:hypothetical protein
MFNWLHIRCCVDRGVGPCRSSSPRAPRLASQMSSTHQMAIAWQLGDTIVPLTSTPALTASATKSRAAVQGMSLTSSTLTGLLTAPACAPHVQLTSCCTGTLQQVARSKAQLQHKALSGRSAPALFWSQVPGALVLPRDRMDSMWYALTARTKRLMRTRQVIQMKRLSRSQQVTMSAL